MQIVYFLNQKVMKIKQGKKINFTMNKDIYYKPCGNGHASKSREKWSAESDLCQVWCIDNDFVAENIVSESNKDQSGVFSKGFLQKMFGFLPKKRLRIRNTDNIRQQLYFL